MKKIFKRLQEIITNIIKSYLGEEAPYYLWDQGINYDATLNYDLAFRKYELNLYFHH